MPIEHTHVFSTAEHTWTVSRLWELAEGLPIEVIPIKGIQHLDEMMWETHMNLQMFVNHAIRVDDANLWYPILIHPNGWVMDGYHRIAKAMKLGLESILAVRFVEEPEPDQEE